MSPKTFVCGNYCRQILDDCGCLYFDGRTVDSDLAPFSNLFVVPPLHEGCDCYFVDGTVFETECPGEFKETDDRVSCLAMLEDVERILAKMLQEIRNASGPQKVYLVRHFPEDIRAIFSTNAKAEEDAQRRNERREDPGPSDFCYVDEWEVKT